MKIKVIAATCILFVFNSGLSFAGCVSHSSRSVSGGIHIDVGNNCSEGKNVNVCVRKSDSQWQSGEKNGQFVRVGRSFRFQFNNFGNATYKYRVKWCSPGRTTKVNNCEASC